MSKRHEQSEIDKQIEWQKHQYSPGYNIGEKSPMNKMFDARPMTMGIFFLISGVMMTGILFMQLFEGLAVVDTMDFFAAAFSVLMRGAVACLLLIVGIRLIKRGVRRRRNLEDKITKHSPGICDNEDK